MHRRLAGEVYSQQNDQSLPRVNFDSFMVAFRFANVFKEGSGSALPSPTGERQLKVETDLSGDGARSDIVRAAKGGKKIVQSVLVCDVDGRELETHLVLIAAEQVVMSDGNVKQASRRDTRRVLVVVLRVRLRHI